MPDSPHPADSLTPRPRHKILRDADLMAPFFTRSDGSRIPSACTEMDRLADAIDEILAQAGAPRTGEADCKAALEKIVAIARAATLR